MPAELVGGQAACGRSLLRLSQWCLRFLAVVPIIASIAARRSKSFLIRLRVCGLG
jgi:hypothetical protein